MPTLDQLVSRGGYLGKLFKEEQDHLNSAVDASGEFFRKLLV